MKIIYFRNKKTLYFEGSHFKLTQAVSNNLMLDKYFFVDNELLCNYHNWDIVNKCSSTNEYTLFKNASATNNAKPLNDKDKEIIITCKESDVEYNIDQEFKNSYLRKKKIKSIIGGI